MLCDVTFVIDIKKLIYLSMSEKKNNNKKVIIELDPIQLVWLHSQHLFQKIEQEALKVG